jgi:hypothetical protein
MNSKGGNFWVWFLTLPLLAFSAYRNLDLILSTMGGDPGSIIAGIGALFALDLGVLFWLQAFNGARGNQRSVAGVMIVIDLIGAVAGLLADTLLRSGGKESIDLIRVVSNWAIPIIIGVNFACGILYHASDPDRRLKDRQRELDDLLKERLADALQANSGAIVADAVPHAMRHQQQEAVSQFLAGILGSTAPVKSPNGHTPEVVTLNSEGVDAGSVAHPTRGRSPKA